MIKWDDYWKQYSVSKAEQWLIEQRDNILNRYLDLIDKSQKHVIEIGCGFGSNIRLLNYKRNDIVPYALDLSSMAIERIKDEIKNAYVEDCEKTSFKDNSFDLIYSAGLMEHFRNENKFLKEMKRILKKDGFMITFVPAKYSLWQLYQLLHFGHWKHGYEKAYTVNSLKYTLQKNGFNTVEIGGIDPLSLPGFLMKLTNRKFNINFNKSPIKSGYTEIYIVSINGDGVA